MIYSIVLVSVYSRVTENTFCPFSVYISWEIAVRISNMQWMSLYKPTLTQCLTVALKSALGSCPVDTDHTGTGAILPLGFCTQPCWYFCLCCMVLAYSNRVTVDIFAKWKWSVRSSRFAHELRERKRLGFRETDASALSGQGQAGTGLFTHCVWSPRRE